MKASSAIILTCIIFVFISCGNNKVQTEDIIQDIDPLTSLYKSTYEQGESFSKIFNDSIFIKYYINNNTCYPEIYTNYSGPDERKIRNYNKIKTLGFKFGKITCQVSGSRANYKATGINPQGIQITVDYSYNEELNISGLDILFYKKGCYANEYGYYEMGKWILDYYNNSFGEPDLNNPYIRLILEGKRYVMDDDEASIFIVFNDQEGVRIMQRAIGYGYTSDYYLLFRDDNNKQEYRISPEKHQGCLYIQNDKDIATIIRLFEAGHFTMAIVKCKNDSPYEIFNVTDETKYLISALQRITKRNDKERNYMF